MRVVASLVVLAAVSVLAAGCVAPPVMVSSAVQMPARSTEASRLRTVAVLPFGARGETDVTAEVEAALVQVLVEEKKYFTLVERGRLDDAIKEMQLAGAGVVDPAAAARLGKMVAAQGIYTGAVTRDESHDQPYSEARRACAQRNLVRNKQGNLVEGPCASWRDYQVSCTRRTADFEFVPKLIAVESGRVIYSRSVGAGSQESVCEDQTQALTSPGEMRRKARARAVQLFRQDVAPYQQMVQVAFMTSVEGIAAPAAKEAFASSMQFARANRLDRACEVWQDIGKSEPASMALAFNNGVCAEVAGDLGAALDLFSKADRMTTRPEALIAEGMKRVRDRQAAEAKLRAQTGGQTAVAPAKATAQSAAPAAAAVPTATATAAVAAAESPVVADKALMLKAQLKLRQLGYGVGTPDGIAGARTKAALQDYQRKNSLAVSGELDSATMKALGLI
ncbi:MAG: peptidoglycan-binding protein [Rubrivivax sp.]|nr:peptidoglycan-binding protein [Rubrivivax sp.]